MSLLDIFRQRQPQHDPYWGFDKSIQFKPKLNQVQFFKLTGFEFGEYVRAPISKFIKDTEHEISKGICLSYGQKVLYYWWYIDAQVKNGGFVQFFFNGYGPYLPTIIKGLEHIEDNKMANLIQKAEKIYQKNIKLINKARENDLFGSDVYERLDELSDLDQEYYKLSNNTMSEIEKYIRKNPNEFCFDEDGKEFNMEFGGEFKTYYSNNRIKEVFLLENGIVTGEFKSYFENGMLKENIQYEKGERTGEREEYYENGNLKYSCKKERLLNQFRHQWFYENGNAEKLEHKQIDKDERIGEFKEWYENGQLKKTQTYISHYERQGELLEFYEDGNKKMEAEFKNGEYLLHNYWSESGEHTLKNGTGLYFYETYILKDPFNRHENQYKNYKLHGEQKTFTNDVLTHYYEMADGVNHGYTRAFYNNGKLKAETLYENGKVLSTKLFPKSANLKGKVMFQYIMKDEWLLKEELPTADSYPVCKNEEEIKKIIRTPKLLLEPEYQDIRGSTRLWLTVDDIGNVTNIEFKSAYMTNSEEFKEVADKMKFKPALKDGKPMLSYIYIIANFEIE